MINWQRI
ncbi:hypothetical protein M8C21_029623 [Ambrosia artemisiifolia]|nr:hypothetical protein M8C21_029623 [Ambrosia artemisiifolia]